MPVQPTALLKSEYAPNATTTVYTSPASVYTRIDKVTVTNATAGAQTITIYVVPNGGTAGGSNTTTSAQSVLPGQTWNSPNEPGLYLNPGDFIAVIASAASALSIVIGGTQIS